MNQDKLDRAARAAGFAMVEFEDTLSASATREQPPFVTRQQPGLAPLEPAAGQPARSERSWASQDWLNYFARRATAG